MRYPRYAFFPRKEFPFFIDRYVFRRDEAIPRHTHDFFELVYVEQGSSIHVWNDASCHLKAGDLFLLEPGVYHSYSDPLNEQTIVYNVMYLPELLNDELKRQSYFMNFSYLAPFLRYSPCRYPYINLSGLTKMKVENYLTQMLQEARHRRPGHELMIQTLMLQLLIEIGRYQLNMSNVRQEKQMEEQRMQYILSLLHECYNQPPTFSEFSRLCNMSPSTLAYKLKRATGKSYVEYLRMLQLKEACRLLSQTDRKIIDIAMDTGFQDVSYFYRVFRRHMGCTPLEFRNAASTRSFTESETTDPGSVHSASAQAKHNLQ